MYSEQDLLSLYDFLRHTPEGHLKKMLLTGKMTEAHINILLKVVRSCGNNDFVTHANAATLPKVKLAPTEVPLKEVFWPVALETCATLGLISKPAKAA